MPDLGGGVEKTIFLFVIEFKECLIVLHTFNDIDCNSDKASQKNKKDNICFSVSKTNFFEIFLNVSSANQKILD